MKIILQDNDPHRPPPDFNYAYYFLIPVVIFAVAIMFAAPKFRSCLDNRFE